MKALNTYLLASLAAALIGYWFLSRLLAALDQAMTQFMLQMR